MATATVNAERPLRTGYDHVFFQAFAAPSQAWKRERLRGLGIAEPASSTFLAVDLEQQNLLEALREAQLGLQGPTFISWLGVTQYLTRDGVLETLRQIASMPTFRFPR